MREYDEMIARQCEQDGVRMASGHHIGSPIPRHEPVPLDTPWYSHSCSVTREHQHCPLRYEDGRICSCTCHSRPVEWALMDWQFPDDTEDPWVDRRDNDR